MAWMDWLADHFSSPFRAHDSSWLGGYQPIAILNATVVGALIPYTYFNIKPARFQMGDVVRLSGRFWRSIPLPSTACCFFLLGYLLHRTRDRHHQVFGRYLLGRRIFKWRQSITTLNSKAGAKKKRSCALDDPCGCSAARIMGGTVLNTNFIFSVCQKEKFFASPPL